MLNILSRRKRYPGWLVVLPRREKLMLAHVDPAGARPRVHFCEERDFDAVDPKSLERIAREFRAERFQCTTLLRPDQYQMFVVDAPNVNSEELRSAVRWRIKDMLDFPLDEAVIDVLDIPPVEATGARAAHFNQVVAARAGQVRNLINMLEQAKFPLSVVEIPETAQRNIAGGLESGGRGLVLVTFDENGGLITFTSGGELYMSRRIELTAENLAEQDEAVRNANLDRAALEVQRSLDHFERQYVHVALDRCLVGPLPAAGIAVLRQRGAVIVNDLAERLRTSLYIPVELLEISAILDQDGISVLSAPAGQCRWLKLLGAGLRIEPAKS